MYTGVTPSEPTTALRGGIIIHLKRLVGKAHPNVYEFVEVIQKEQTTEVSVTQLEAGAHPPRRALKAITRDRNIQELKERFDTNTTTLRKCPHTLMSKYCFIV